MRESLEEFRTRIREYLQNKGEEVITMHDVYGSIAVISHKTRKTIIVYTRTYVLKDGRYILCDVSITLAGRRG